MVALMFACCEGHLPVVGLLRQYGAKVNVIDRNGKTVLMYACCEGHVPVVELLLQYGVDVNVIDSALRNKLACTLLKNIDELGQAASKQVRSRKLTTV